MPACSVSPVSSVAEALDRWRAGDRVQVLRSEFLDVLPPDVRVGVVGFGTQPSLLAAPTTDRALLASRVGELTAVLAGGTQGAMIAVHFANSFRLSPGTRARMLSGVGVGI